MIDCWGLVTLEGLAAELQSGWVATTFEEGGRASVHDTVMWEFSKPRTWVPAEMLLGEIRDDIDRLNRRPTSVRRAWAAVDAAIQASIDAALSASITATHDASHSGHDGAAGGHH